jgi:hypothetical protein
MAPETTAPIACGTATLTTGTVSGWESQVGDPHHEIAKWNLRRWFLYLGVSDKDG